MMRTYLHFAAVLASCSVILGVLAQPSFGLVNTSNDPDYRTAPANDPGWTNVGEMFNGTGVYLGDGWVIAPWHVYRPQSENENAYIDLDQRYHQIPGTVERIIDDSTGIAADLVLFRIDGDPDVGAGDPGPGKGIIDISLTPVGGIGQPGQIATIIGTGLGRDGGLQTWPYPGVTYTGFNTTDTRVKQWGSNKIAHYPHRLINSYGTTDVTYSMFDDDPPRSEETQPVDKDSGGAVFIDWSGQWELSGLAVAMVSVPGYPSGDLPLREHAVYGTGALYVDLMSYYDEIAAVRDNPLPGDANWDGRVNLHDFNMLRKTFGDTGDDMPTDFEPDGVIDDADLEILQRNFGMSSGHGLYSPGGAPIFSPVLAPEPATMFVMLGAAPLLLRSRRRRRAA